MMESKNYKNEKNKKKKYYPNWKIKSQIKLGFKFKILIARGFLRRSAFKEPYLTLWCQSILNNFNNKFEVFVSFWDPDDKSFNSNISMILSKISLIYKFVLEIIVSKKKKKKKKNEEKKMKKKKWRKKIHDVKFLLFDLPINPKHTSINGQQFFLERELQFHKIQDWDFHFAFRIWKVFFFKKKKKKILFELFKILERRKKFWRRKWW